MTRHDTTTSDAIVSPIVSSRQRRKRGTGSIFRDKAGGWIVSLSTKLGKRRRHAVDYPDAKRQLAALKREFRAQLPTAYRPWRRIDGDLVYRGVRPSLRFTILTRDGFRCTYCGATAADERLMVDHIVPVSAGGSDDESNLATACEPCNLGKGAR